MTISTMLSSPTLFFCFCNQACSSFCFLNKFVYIKNLIRMYDSGLQETKIIITSWLGIYRDVRLHKDYILRNSFFKFVFVKYDEYQQNIAYSLFSLGIFLKY
jgi:hypothetical protein